MDNDLIKLAKQYLQEEYAPGDCVLADLDTCNYFREHFRKQPAAPKHAAPLSPTPPKYIKPAPPPPAAKIEKAPIIPVPEVDHSEFKKLFSNHFPDISIVDPPSP
jgi:hypothetical protein